RSSWSIIWSCLSTIFLCTWVAIHPNVHFRPETQGQKWYKRYLWDPFHEFVTYRLVLFIWALLIPEYILAWAVRQYIQAGKIRDGVPGWTRTHGFFMVMGGFHLFRLPADTRLPYETKEVSGFVVSTGEHSRRDAVPVCPLKFEDFPTDILEIMAPTEIELKDKDKSDSLTKIIVLMQTLWFVIQCITRGTQHLPLTELEVVTLAYAMLNFFIYIFWWDKPQNVECPIRVYKTSTASHEKRRLEWSGNWVWRWMKMISAYTIGLQDRYATLSKQCSTPMFWSGQMKEGHLFSATLGPAILGSAFGAIHCIAWSSKFPSSDELVLWRISCIAMITVPFIPRKLSKLRKSITEACLTGIFFLLIVASFVLYIVSRIATLVIAFTSLRSLPPAALATVEWTTFIPH
ncbi:hypothetical protein M408DRAFT_57683, partial [Serendipita vermifera MAFF 305830]